MLASRALTMNYLPAKRLSLCFALLCFALLCFASLYDIIHVLYGFKKPPKSPNPQNPTRTIHPSPPCID